MSADVLLRALLLIPSVVIFLYCVTKMAKSVETALKLCHNPMLVKTLPFLFVINRLFTQEGVAQRNSALGWLLGCIFIWLVCVAGLLAVEGKLTMSGVI
ncbi:hypothetical protein [Bowmanella pacifica]|uniref:hypothetical protein n=1 Tax=Bowmanella pacifica TaxID=502051 RepID=UPI00166DB13C|nr:hypothetical protein [Bowmanella pacifica]